jgi:hypothetical protein
MSRFFVGMGMGIAVAAIATAFAAVVKTREPQRVSSAVDSAPLCYVTNKFKAELQVEVIESKFTSGTYFIQLKQRGIFFCGDKVSVLSGKYKSRLTLKSSITFEDTQVSEKLIPI